MTSSTNTQNLLAACRAEIPALTSRLMVAIFTDNPEWTDYSPVTRADLQEGCRRYLTRVLDLLGSNSALPESDDVAASIGIQRAQQGVPLEVMLRTFRLGGRILWDALLSNADDIGPAEFREVGPALWAVIDGLSSSLVTSYRRTELEQVRRDERHRHALIEDLLTGRAHDTNFAARAARELNLPVEGTYVVVTAHGNTPTLRIGTDTALAALGIRSVWHDRVNTTVGLVSIGKQRITTVLQHLRQQVCGPAAASPPVQGLAQVDTAHALALVALETLPTDTQGLVSLDERYPEALLVRSPDLTEMLVSDTLGPVLDLHANERDILLQTLTIWLAQNRSAANAAPLLNCHRNTVINRLQRISTLLDRSLEGQRSYVELSLALAALRLRKPRD
ncbi:PucR family transcriptional regulator [Nocardia sp. CA-107356]|uniref:PucR family transcriptional regulator n=1 Tax=Nocardia sp. CA-107356 TaxID=3239972 RepID=UPI003D8AD4C1